MHKTSKEFLNDLLQLKTNIRNKLPTGTVIFSALTIHTDNGKTAITINHLNNHLSQLKLDCIDNNNMRLKHIRKRDLKTIRKGRQ